MRGTVAAVAATTLLALPAAASAWTPATYTTGAAPNGVVTADFDGDLHPDLAVVGGRSNDLHVLLGHPGGAFAAVSGSPFNLGGQGSNYAAAGDVNGDSRPDVAVANFTTNNLSVMLHRSDGSFVAAPGTPLAAAGASAAAIADFNSDGRGDVAVALWNVPAIRLYLNNGSGFTAENDYPTGANPRRIAVTDLNGDGRPDMIVADWGGADLTLLTRRSTNNGYDMLRLGTGEEPSGLAVGDFNGDGLSDFAVSNQTGNSVTAYLRASVGGAYLEESVAPQVNDPTGIAAGDFDGDGRTDLAVANEAHMTGGSVSILHRRTSDDWVADAPIPVPAGAYDIAAADFDGDGRSDLAVTGGFPVAGAPDPTQTTILLNPAPPPIPPVIVADADHDGIPDAADNCPAAANASQLDTDKDGIGDACEVLPNAVPPKAGERALVRAVSGSVLVKVPSSGSYVPLAGSASLPVGAVVDARNGTLAVTSAVTRRGKTATATVSAGIFRIKQARARGTATVATDLVLTTPAGKAKACAARKAPAKGVVRSLTVATKGLFRAVAAKGIVRATNATWTSSDRCDGTLTKVKRGKVAVKAGKRTRTVRAGHSLLIKARLFGAKRRTR